MLETMMRELNIPHLTGQMLPEFKWRLSVLAQATGQRLFISELELVKRMGYFMVGVEEMDRAAWLTTLGQKVADHVAKQGVYDMIGELTEAQFGTRIYTTALTLRKDIGLSNNYWMLRFDDGSVAWITALPVGYRIPTHNEILEIRKALTLLNNAKEKLASGSESIAV